MMPTSPVIHVVLVRWKAEADPDAVLEIAQRAREFPETIPGVLTVHCGPNTSPEGLGGGFEWALVVGFTNSSARDDYLPHAAHRPVAELITLRAAQVVVFDVDRPCADA